MIKFKGQRIDNQEWVSGYHFKTPLTDENSGTDSEDGWFFLSGEERHCISNEEGVACVVVPESVQVDIESLNMANVSLGEYIATVYSRVRKAKDDALAVDEMHTMVNVILGIK